MLVLLKIPIQIIFLITAFIASSCAWSFSISPMFIDMSPNGSDTRSKITATNTSPRPMPVSISISEVILDVNGKISTSPQNNDFLIFPPRAVIKPHGKQTFRIQWRSQPNLSQAKTYQVTVSQVLAKDQRPKEDSNNTAVNIQFGIAFSSFINMKAASGAPKPLVKHTRLGKTKSGKPAIETTISNNSNQNFFLIQADSTVTLTGVNNKKLWSSTYKPNDMLRNFGLGIVQPNKTRRMTIALPNLPDHIARQAKSAKLEVRPSAK